MGKTAKLVELLGLGSEESGSREQRRRMGAPGPWEEGPSSGEMVNLRCWGLKKGEGEMAVISDRKEVISDRRVLVIGRNKISDPKGKTVIGGRCSSTDLPL